MENDELLEFSGEMPNDDISLQLLNEEHLTNGTNSTEDVLTTTVTNINNVSMSPYTPNIYRIIWLSFRTIFTLLLVILTATIRKRDFLKFFVLFILFPILLETGFDIYSEIRTSNSYYGASDLPSTYFMGNYYNGAAHNMQSKALVIYEEMLAYYTTYNIYKELAFLPLVVYILGDFLFWSFIVSSVLAYGHSHKAINRPDEVGYIMYWWSYLKVQILPVLMVLIDVGIAMYPIQNSGVMIGVTAVPRIVAILVAFTLATQTFMSLFLFCVRRDDYTKTSPHDQVRCSKWRLCHFLFFQILNGILNAPYFVWSGLSLAEDFKHLFGLDYPVPYHLSIDAFVAHLTSFLLRPMLLPILVIFFIIPYRKVFVKVFCCCCRKKE